MENEILIITDMNFYNDGGTLEVNTNKGDYFIDNRLQSKTKGEIYLNYPEGKNKPVSKKEKEVIISELNSAIAKHFYDEPIIHDDERIDLLTLKLNEHFGDKGEDE